MITPTENEKLEDLVGTFYCYNYEEYPGDLIEYAVEIWHENDKFFTEWEHRKDFSFTGEIIKDDNLIYVASQGKTHNERVLSIFPIPNNRRFNMLWGFGVGKTFHGLPAFFRVLFSRKRIGVKAAQKVFDDYSITPEKAIMVLDYDVMALNDYGDKEAKELRGLYVFCEKKENRENLKEIADQIRKKKQRAKKYS